MFNGLRWNGKFRFRLYYWYVIRFVQKPWVQYPYLFFDALVMIEKKFNDIEYCERPNMMKAAAAANSRYHKTCPRVTTDTVFVYSTTTCEQPYCYAEKKSNSRWQSFARLKTFRTRHNKLFAQNCVPNCFPTVLRN